MRSSRTARHTVDYKFLIEAPEDSEALAALEEKLTARSCHHKRRNVPRSNLVRLLVAKRDFEIAFRVMTELAALAGKFSGVEGLTPGKLHVNRKSGPHASLQSGSGEVIQ
jgi:hypothetical protein